MNQDPIEAIDDSDPGKESQFPQDHLADSRGNNFPFYMVLYWRYTTTCPGWTYPAFHSNQLVSDKLFCRRILLGDLLTFNWNTGHQLNSRFIVTRS